MKLFKFPTTVPTGDLVENLPFRQIPDKLRHSSAGGVPPTVRSSIVRVLVAKLSITGVLAALVSISASNKDAAFACSLSAAVNFVAAVHYWYILKIRSQELTSATQRFAFGRSTEGSWVGREQEENEDAKMFVQEFAVDGLRHSDWAVTLAALTLELYALQFSATGGATPWLDKWTAAALAPVMIFFGSLYRFFANELRGRDSAESLGPLQLFVGIASYLVSCAIFCFVVFGITDPILNEVCVPSNSTATCPITDPSRKADADAVLVFAFCWIGYPVVSLFSRIVFLPTFGFPTDARASVFKDLCYGALDATAKGGLAIYVSYRTTWLK